MQKPSKQLNVVKSTSVYISAAMLPMMVGFFMLPVYTRYMDPSDFGILTLLNTFSALLMTFFGLQLGSSITWYYYRHDPEDTRTYFSTLVWSTLIINLIFLIPIHLLGDHCTRLFFPKVDFGYFPHIFLALITAFFVSINICATLLLKVQSRGTAVLCGTLVHVVIGVGLNLFFVVHRGYGAVGVLLSSAINALLHTLMLGFLVRSHLRLRWDRSMMSTAFSFSLPLVPNALGAVLFIYTDKWLLGYFVTMSSVGLYGIAHRISQVMELLIRAYKDAYSPEFMADSIQDQAAAATKYGEVLVRWLAVMTGVALAFSLFSPEMLRLLTPPEYHAAHVFIPPLVSAFLFRGLYFFTLNTLLFEKKTRMVPLITLTAGVANVAANVFLIPVFGAPAAAFTTLGANALTFLMGYVLSKRYYPLNYNWREISGLMGLGLVVYIVATKYTGSGLIANLLCKTIAVLLYTIIVFGLNMGRCREPVGVFLHHITSRKVQK